MKKLSRIVWRYIKPYVVELIVAALKEYTLSRVDPRTVNISMKKIKERLDTERYSRI